MLEAKLSRFASLPGLEIYRSEMCGKRVILCAVKERAQSEVCHRCATPADTGYDSRTVKVRDEPLRNGGHLELIVTKRRWYRKACRKPFTETLAGVLPKQHCTQRFKRTLLRAAETFSSLKDVRETYK